MDNQSRQISIKINGKEKIYTEDKKHESNSREPMLAMEEMAASVESSNKDDDIWAELSNSTDSKSHKTTESIGIEDLRGTSLPRKKSSRKKPGFQSNSFRNFIFASVFAIIVGTGFSILLFNLLSITGDGEELPAANMLDDTGEKVELEEQPAQSGAGSNNTPAATVPVVWDPLTVTVVQAGAFSSLESSKPITDKLENAGLPVLLHGNDPILLFTGIADAKAAGKQLADAYEYLLPDIYVKDYTVQGATLSLSAEEELTARKTKELLTKLIGVSSQLLSISASPTDIEELQRLAANIQVPANIQNPSLTQFVDYTKQAVNVLSSSADKWRLQTQTLQAFGAYINWLETTEKNTNF
ncbi:hypothetical protein EJF36_14650 [Bacillus sp. HMF5848]|uniref:hypothetical protein n=1 Tax=Bacillus sp. HMF5848 TaxID=2495421 RepID=UPI000F7A730C|nr:hypothetical protein [Bacillus sp. HMF5848]RSK28018.1 hypothetical protein EJF36_14650 [Bacillus sp. HMF5848]